jgi:hypothetical protein
MIDPEFYVLFDSGRTAGMQPTHQKWSQLPKLMARIFMVRVKKRRVSKPSLSELDEFVNLCQVVESWAEKQEVEGTRMSTKNND